MLHVPTLQVQCSLCSSSGYWSLCPLPSHSNGSAKVWDACILPSCVRAGDANVAYSRQSNDVDADYPVLRQEEEAMVASVNSSAQENQQNGDRSSAATPFCTFLVISTGKLSWRKSSIERVLAFDEYSRTTSLCRVLLVCVGTPMPMAILVILQELLPLQDPTAGWSSNYGFWVRVTMLSAVTANIFLVFKEYLLLTPLPFRGTSLPFIVSLIHTAASAAVAANLVFPIPFYYITMTPSFYVPIIYVAVYVDERSSVTIISFVVHRRSWVWFILFTRSCSTRWLTKNTSSQCLSHGECLVPYDDIDFDLYRYHATRPGAFENAPANGDDFGETTSCYWRLADENLLAALCLLCRNPTKFKAQLDGNVRVRSCLQHRLNPENNNILFLLEKPAAEAPHPIHCWPMTPFMISPWLEEAMLQSGIASSPTTCCARIHAWSLRLVRLWTSLQVSYHGGKYSIERVLALDKYSRTTSLFRVVVVCIGTPLPMVTLVTLQELLPLQEPQAGWRQNYGFWFRVFMLAAAVSHTYLIQGKYMVDDFVQSSRRLVLFVLGISGIYTVVGMIVAANLVFPIPFFYITMTPAFYAPLLTLLYSILGHSHKLTKYVSFIVTQKVMGMLYPVYQLLFRTASTSDFVLPVILLLPVIKIIVKNILLHFTHHLEDLTPEAVIFTVDFYNALYLATCMESASTLNTMLIFIVTDFAQTVTVLIGMHRRTATILKRLQESIGTTESGTVLRALSSMCHNLFIIEAQFRSGVHVRSCFKHKLDRDDRQLLYKLERLPVKPGIDSSRIYCWSSAKGTVSQTRKLTSLRFASFSSSFTRLTSSRRSTTVQPIVQASATAKRKQGRVAGGPDGIPTNLIEHANILRETLEVLYTTECLVLTAYLEAFIPLFYCTYMIFMVQMPNAQYHTELRSVTRQNVAYTARVILYNLAFVLETQMALVQGKLMIWMLVTLACRVVHFGKSFQNVHVYNNVLSHNLDAGADYSLQFAWIR
ncbi:unnamed protein product [Phytophthora lilii]|uniref:Unnamed protein product n=1 Tax=Phytophthora lilii TaxID=2077276 RepID=A0A9W6TWN2_9STRA|nr:unnamed protein product [Phytophthora lilii]